MWFNLRSLDITQKAINKAKLKGRIKECIKCHAELARKMTGKAEIANIYPKIKRSNSKATLRTQRQEIRPAGANKTGWRDEKNTRVTNYKGSTRATNRTGIWFEC